MKILGVVVCLTWALCCLGWGIYLKIQYFKAYRTCNGVVIKTYPLGLPGCIPSEKK